MGEWSSRQKKKNLQETSSEEFGFQTRPSPILKPISPIRDNEWQKPKGKETELPDQTRKSATKRFLNEDQW